MKNFAFILLVFFSVLLNSCSFSKYYYNSGDNDTAIGVAVARLKSNPKNWREALVLERAYKEAFDKDISRINYLKKEGNPDCWMEVYEHYAAINKRQNLVRPLLPIFIKKEYRNAEIKMIDVDAEMIESKRKAAEYLYAHALQLMDRNTKIDYRKAYDEFNQLKSYMSNYKDADNKQQIAYNKGQNHVLIAYKNNSNLLMPRDFEKAILEINAAQYNTQWVKYDIASSTDKKEEDYRIVINLQDINISPEQVREREYVEEKNVEDGWTYAIDSKGNVKKDSLGNDIKIKKYSNVKCVIRETVQNKQGAITGAIEYYKVGFNTSTKANSYQLLQAMPYNENLVFTNIFATAQGDQRALTEDSRRKIGGRPLPFPSNIQMVMDASNILKGRLSEAVRINQNMVLN